MRTDDFLNEYLISTSLECFERSHIVTGFVLDGKRKTNDTRDVILREAASTVCAKRSFEVRARSYGLNYVLSNCNAKILGSLLNEKREEPMIIINEC